MRDVFWFNPHTFDDEKDWQVQLGVLFNAHIKWLDDGLEQDVIMATYDTEGMPEDNQVFFSFDCMNSNYSQLVKDLEGLNDEWEVLECDLYE